MIMETPGMPSTGDPRTAVSRDLALFMLRQGLGVYLLNQGLVLRLSQRMGPIPTGASLVIPYVNIIFGLALVLGLFTTVAAAVAGFSAILEPLLATLFMVAGGAPVYGGRGFGLQGPWFSGALTHVIAACLLLWFLPQAKNRWSLDVVVFGKRRDAGALPARNPRPGGDAAPPAGERTARFLAERKD
jgi:hypothetical protein